VICARLYYEWKNIGGAGMRDEGVESSKGLLLLNKKKLSRKCFCFLLYSITNFTACILNSLSKRLAIIDTPYD
jgi:hypothetical protein